MYAVRYTSTTGQQWDEAHCVVENSEGVWRCSNGCRRKTENRFLTSEDDREKYASQPWINLSAGPTEEGGYWYVYGDVIENGHHVARIGMIPTSG